MSNTNETNNKNFKRKFKIVKVIMISIIIIAIISLTGIGFAKYITSLKGSSEVQIAKWNFKVTAGSSENLTIDLAQTRYENDTTEVDKTKVAPGTKGEIVFNIDGNDSQVSLEYDINMSLTQIPENLIFYTDEQMTNAVYKDNGEMHLNGYFGVDNENKKETKTLYWQWKLETGTTQEEIENNDVLDSKWMDKDISLGINAVGRQVADESSTTKCEVTFDLNGGKLASYGDSKQITKQVNYGENYGKLPVPTREGYVFKGWNGKNMFNENKILMAINGAEFKNEHYLFFCGAAHTSYFSGINEISGFKPNTQYSLTVKGYENVYEGAGNTITNFRIGFRYTDNTESFQALNSNSEKKITYSSIPNKTIKQIYMTYGWNGNIYLSYVQLEEGANATTYEPYIIEETTPITQNKNHTLTAIWEKEQ